MCHHGCTPLKHKDHRRELCDFEPVESVRMIKLERREIMHLNTEHEEPFEDFEELTDDDDEEEDWFASMSWS